jgi:FAD/FMN-containing dehydrogenase
MLRSTTSRHVVSMSAVAPAASLANCNGPLAADQSAAAEPDLGIVRSVSRAADIILPLDAYYLAKDEDLQRDAAVRVLRQVERTLIGDRMDAAESASFGYHGSADDVVDRENEVQSEAKQEQLTRAARLAAEK